jgi:hypothetical protein
MDILNKPINTFKFEDVVAFCKEGYPEGVQVDYKKDFPQKGIAKHFAAFSNTRGGVIIIGVEEDRKSGLPTAWEGVAKDAKQIERIHQEASNVEPVPAYEVHATEEVDGKCFVLVRVYEGDKTPYYVQNDSNVWTRTGNVSNPIDIASPDGLELLFGKKDKAEKARSLYLKIAKENYDAGLEREEKKRQEKIREANKKGESVAHFGENPLGERASLFNVVVQPYFPKKALASPKELKEKLNDFRIRMSREFPNYNMEAIPQGLFHFMHSFDEYIECQQVFTHGLVYSSQNVARTQENGLRTVPVAFLVGRVFVILQFAKSMYNHFGYQGVIAGSASLNDMKDVYTRILKPSGWHFFDDDNKSFLSSYAWDIQLDTNILNNKEQLREWFFSFVREVYWSFGYENVQDAIIDKFLEENRLSF